MEKLQSLTQVFTSGEQVLRQTEAPTATASFVGDISLVRGVADRLTAEGSKAFCGIDSLLAADLVVGNLETPLSPAHLDPVRGAFTSQPELARYIFELGFNVFNMANNHTMDCGEAGLKDTLEVLHQNGMAHFGAGENLAGATTPLIIEKNGIRFGFIGYSQPELDAATPTSAGVAPLRLHRIEQELEALRGQVDVTIVSLHEGYEFQSYPRLDFMQLCRRSARCGANLIYGHHPHVLQGMETVENCLILYSLGNFLFDMPYHREVSATREGLITHATFDAKGVVALKLIPTYLDDECRLAGITDEARQNTLGHLEVLSRQLGDLEFVREQNHESVRQVMRAVLGAVYQLGKKGDQAGFDKYFQHQIRRDPYLKVFKDYGEMAGLS